MRKEGLISFIARSICFFVAFCLLFVIVQELLRDKWCEGEYDPTVKVKGFYAEEKGNIDVVFFGSSQVYADIAPAVIYRDYGITSYDFCANEQPLSISYYYMKEAFEKQDVKLAVLDTYAVCYDTYAEEGATHINLDDLPMNMNKAGAINASVPKDLRYSYYFPLTKYHGTWKDYYPLKYEFSFYDKRDVNRGYSPFIFPYEYNDGPNEDIIEASKKEWTIPEYSKIWLDKIVELCNEKNVPLLLIKTPCGNAERQLHANGAKAYADENSIPFVNMNLIFDGQAHINVVQAENVSQYIGAYISENYDLPDHRGDKTFDDDWKGAIELFENARQETINMPPMEEE